MDVASAQIPWVNDLVFLLAFLLFAGSARGLIGALTSSPAMAAESFSVRARRLGRIYKIFAWGSLSIFLLAQSLVAFIESFQSL